MVIKKLVALFFMLFPLILVILVTGGEPIFFRFPFLIVVLGVTIAMSLIALRPSELIKSIFGRTDTGLNNLTVDFLGNTFILAGSVGTMIGLILMLANLSDPDELIPGFASASAFMVVGFSAKFIVDSFAVTESSETITSNKSIEKICISPVLSITGIVLFITVIIVSISLGGSVMLFFNAPSVLITFGGGLAATLVSNSWKDIKNSLKGGFGGFYSTVEEAKSAVKVTSNMYNRFIAFGFIGLWIGLLFMLSNISDPDALGPGMAIALITVFYSLGIAVVILAFGISARRQVQWFGEDEKPDLFISPAAAGLIAIGITLVAFSLLLVSFIQIPG